MGFDYSDFFPSVDSLLKRNYLFVHEAAFLLTKCPENGFTACKQSPPDHGDHFFYAPVDPEASYRKLHQQQLNGYTKKSPKSFSETIDMLTDETKKMFVDIVNAIENGELPAIHNPLTDGITFSIKPSDLILWALNEDYILPHDLQKAKGVFQMANRSNKTLVGRVKNKIVAQYILNSYPELTLMQLINHPLMKKYGKECCDSRKRMIKLALQDVLDRRSDPISEVILNDSDGNLRYQLRLLNESIKMLVQIMIHEKDECKIAIEQLVGGTSKNTEEILSLILEDKVIGLYLRDSTDFILDLVKSWCIEYVGAIIQFQSHSKILQQMACR